MYGIRNNLYEEIINIFRLFDIKKAILFGSRARGDFKNASDIDIAIEFSVSNKDNFIKLFTKLEDLNTLYKFDIVDLESLNDDSAFKKEITKDGIIIYEKN